MLTAENVPATKPEPAEQAAKKTYDGDGDKGGKKGQQATSVQNIA